ncbi:hypothetical protein [Pedobacter frigiditerrae]|uniref:hypothetical protein n=1 Tax=Pedobacter frigiditerrae TaxID=2530452 RepID=UPI00292DF035|nr:hypothetical protein [Pedobacter frigiditerrae]
MKVLLASLPSVLFLISTYIIIPVDAKASTKKQDIINNLNKSNGKYPSEITLFENKELSKRLKSLLKDRFFFLKKTWAVETPIEVKNNIFKAWGCKQHFCDRTNFIIVVDFKKNVIYVGIRDNENVKVYSKDGSINIEVNNWAKRIS